MRRQNAANESLLKLCVVLCYGMRLQHFELDLYSDVTVLRPVHVWLRPTATVQMQELTIMTLWVQVPNSCLI